MADSSSGLSLEDAENTLNFLTGALEDFVQAWSSDEIPPDLWQFLPKDGNLRRITLIELIKIDLEYRWGEYHLPKTLDDYAQEFVELQDGNMPLDLIYEEFHIRKQSGEDVNPTTFLQRFPEQADSVARLLGFETPYQSTALYKETPSPKLEEIDVGQQIDEFDLLARLGRGAFARVFLARQNSMQRLVALKISADKGTEPQTLAQLDHDYIVRVYDQRTLPDEKLRLLYMQYQAGGTLHDVIAKLRETPLEERDGSVLLKAIDQGLENRGETRPTESSIRQKLAKMSWPEVVCWLGSRLALALDYAHGKGVLHRDVKPANVLLTSEGVPKLADFNISFSAKLAGAAPAAYFGGSLAYMSPEQLEACNPSHERQPDSLDHQSDLYSLGVLLWELLTGERPYVDLQIDQHWTKTLRQMRDRRWEGVADEQLAHIPADCPPSLRKVLLVCLAADPVQRWSSGAELARQLELCLKPRAQAILYPAEESLQKRMFRGALLWILLATMLPNGLAAWFNFVYNKQEIIDQHLTDVADAFQRIQLIINAILFPIGFAISIALAVPLVKTARRLSRGSPGEQHAIRSAPDHLRHRCLRLGFLLALVSVCEWILGGIAYPISIHLARGSMPLDGYLHFFGSLLLCGLIAAVYPFFLLTCFNLRVLYPHLLQGELSAKGDPELLVSLRRFSWVYLILAMAVPMLGILSLTLIGSEARFALMALSAGGLLGFGGIFVLFRQLQSDLDALIDAMPTERN